MFYNVGWREMTMGDSVPRDRDFEVDLEKGKGGASYKEVEKSSNDTVSCAQMQSLPSSNVKSCGGGGCVDGQIKGENVKAEKAEKKIAREKRKKALKPPRPPKGPSLDEADKRLIREIYELKSARIERLKKAKSHSSSSSSSSSSSGSSNLFAMVLTVLFFLVLLFQGFSSWPLTPNGSSNLVAGAGAGAGAGADAGSGSDPPHARLRRRFIR